MTCCADTGNGAKNDAYFKNDDWMGLDLSDRCRIGRFQFRTRIFHFKGTEIFTY